MAWPSNDMYGTLGVRPQLGRLPRPEDGDAVVLISDQLWSSWFGRDPSVVGKSYFVSDGMKQIIGVMPPDFKFPSDRTMLWVATPVRLEDVRPGELGTPVVALWGAGDPTTTTPRGGVRRPRRATTACCRSSTTRTGNADFSPARS